MIDMISEKELSGVLNNKDVLLNHLNFMRFHSCTMEWFNIAFVLAQNPEAKMVKTLDAWNIIFEEVKVFEGVRGAFVLKPKVVGNAFHFDKVEVYDIKQLKGELEVGYKTPVDRMLNEVGITTFRMQYGNRANWQRELVNKLASVYFKDMNIHQTHRKFVVDCVLLAHVNALQINEEIQLTVPTDVDVRTMYRQIKEMISLLPAYLKEVFEKDHQSLLEKARKEEVLKRQGEGIAERRARAKETYARKKEGRQSGIVTQVSHATENNTPLIVEGSVEQNDDDWAIEEGIGGDDVMYYA